jgi:hypothetical protein
VKTGREWMKKGRINSWGEQWIVAQDKEKVKGVKVKIRK